MSILLPFGEKANAKAGLFLSSAILDIILSLSILKIVMIPSAVPTAARLLVGETAQEMNSPFPSSIFLVKTPRWLMKFLC